MKKAAGHNYLAKIALSFLGIILTGSVLLCLPISSASGGWTPFVDCLFTATSATCVTGLITLNTATHWSVFGQTVIILMIQMGGLGLMTLTAMFAVFLRRKMSASRRKILMQSAGSLELSSPRILIRHILLGTLIFELTGAAVLSIRFVPMFGAVKGILYSLFHSVSAFCNAGFDLLGYDTPFVSLMNFQNDYLVLTVIGLLIVIGGSGFMLWSDVAAHGFNIKKYSLHAKLCLFLTLGLLLFGAAVILILEWSNTLSGFSVPKKIFHSLFQSITLRTAGFNAVDQAALTDGSKAIGAVLMLIGGCPGSTAGGMKTTTFLVVLLNAVAATRKNTDVVILKRRLDHDTVRQACAVASVYVLLTVISTVAICAIEGLGLSAVLYETASAIGTVGITVGITSSLSTPSLLILTALMYTGRIGGLTMVTLLEAPETNTYITRPTAKILIG